MAEVKKPRPGGHKTRRPVEAPPPPPIEEQVEEVKEPATEPAQEAQEALPPPEEHVEDLLDELRTVCEESPAITDEEMQKRAEKRERQLQRLLARYKPEFCKVVLDHFSNYVVVAVPAIGKTAIGARHTENGNRVVDLYAVPTWMDVLPKLGLKTRKGINEWRKAFPEFDMACEECEEREKEMLCRLGLFGVVDSTFAKYLMSAKYHLYDKQVAETTSTAKETITVNLEGDLKEWSE